MKARTWWMKRTVLSSLLSISAMLTVNMQAGTATWGPATTVTGDSDVSTNGVSVYAVRFYNAASTDPVVNGVIFTSKGANITMTGAFQDSLGAPSGFSAAYRQLLGSDNYGATTLTLNNLVVGQQYEIQVWANDARAGASNQTSTYGMGNSVILNKNVNNSQKGQFAIGAFTADATSQVVTLSGGAYNAVQIRSFAFITAGPVDAGVSTVVSAPLYDVPADASSMATITVTLKDAIGLPVTNKVVTLTSSRGATDTISAASGPSSASGAVTFTATSSTPGTSVFSAVDVTDANIAITQTASVIFTGPVDAGTSTVAVSPTPVGADGSSPALVTVTLKDAGGRFVSGKTVSLSSSRGSADTISSASGPSSASGVVTFTVTSMTTGSAALSATDVTDGNLALTQTATVTFVTLVMGAQQFNSGNVLPSPIIAVSNDLLETSVSSVTGELASQNPRNGTTGTAQATAQPNPGATGLNIVTYNLNLTEGPRGYDITEIRLFSGWGDARAGQSYKISYALVGAPSTYIDLGTVAALRTNGSLLTRTYDLTGTKILRGVAALKFTMINNGFAGSGTVFREFDVLGVKTPPKGTMINFF